jgi:lysyl-tRNA synthetase class 2
VRRFFDEAGFTEVECGLLQAAPCAETHLHGFPTERVRADGTAETLWLPTSPELMAKRLLAAGETKIYDLARAFRNREESAIHAPEFTMLEWYRARETYDVAIADTLAIIRGAAEAAGTARLSHRGREADPATEAVRLTLAEAFLEFAGIDLLGFVADDGAARDRDGFAAAAANAGIQIAADDGWGDIFTRVMAERVEPVLDPSRLTVLYEYPAPEAALARRAAHDRRVAERFEVYACGVELANGFGELTDAAEQRARWVAAMDAKLAIYGERYPVDEDFLAALALMPPTSGVALGFDRLVMLCTGASRIGQVIWTPLE